MPRETECVVSNSTSVELTRKHNLPSTGQSVVALDQHITMKLKPLPTSVCCHVDYKLTTTWCHAMYPRSVDRDQTFVDFEKGSACHPVHPGLETGRSQYCYVGQIQRRRVYPDVTGEETGEVFYVSEIEEMLCNVVVLVN